MQIARTMMKTSSTLTFLPNQTYDKVATEFLADCSRGVRNIEKPIYTYLYEE